MRRNSALVKPGFHPNDDKSSARGDRLQLRSEGRRCLCANQRVGQVAIDLAKVFPSSCRQDSLTAREGNAAKKQEIPDGDRSCRERPESQEERRSPRCAVEKQKKTRTQEQGGAKEKEHDDRRKVWCEFGHDSSLQD